MKLSLRGVKIEVETCNLLQSNVFIETMTLNAYHLCIAG